VIAGALEKHLAIQLLTLLAGEEELVEELRNCGQGLPGFSLIHSNLLRGIFPGSGVEGTARSARLWWGKGVIQSWNPSNSRARVVHEERNPALPR